MTVTIKNVGNGVGWGEYVLHNRQGATTILGNTVLGDKICKSINYKSGNSVNFVISFAKEDSVTQEQSRKIAKEFMHSFMHGYNEDEYHLDLVEHTDTEHLHYHARVPKLNLLTNTQLKLYWHKFDLAYKKAVINDICHRHNLVSGELMKNTLPNPMHKLNQINKWRKKHSKEPLDLKSPKLRRVAEKKIGEYIGELVMTGLTNSINDVKAEIENMGLHILNEGYDRGKEFHYLTVKNDSGKMRIRGDIYGRKFYRSSREDRAKAIGSNRSLDARKQELRGSGKDIEQTLQRERRKRLAFIDKQYGKARERAIKRQIESNIKDDRERGRGTSEKSETIPSTNSRRGTRDIAEIPKQHERDSETMGKSKQKKEQLPMALANAVFSVDSRYSIQHTLAQGTPTKRGVETNYYERVAREQIYNPEDTYGIYLKKQGELNDSTRREVIGTVTDATRSFYSGIERDFEYISEKHRECQDSDRTAVSDVGKISKHIDKLADKFGEEAIRGITEQGRGEGTVFDRAIEKDAEGYSNLSQSTRGIEREFGKKIGIWGNEATEVSRKIELFIARVEQFIEKMREAISQSFDNELGINP